MVDFEWLVKNGAVAAVAVVVYIFLQNYIGEAAKAAWKITAERGSAIVPKVFATVLLILLIAGPSFVLASFAWLQIEAIGYAERPATTTDVKRVFHATFALLGAVAYVWLLGAYIAQGYLKAKANSKQRR